MILQNIQGIILDIDDTLYLERDYVKSGFMAVGEEVHCPDFGQKCWQLFLDGVRNCTFDLAKKEFPDLDIPTKQLVDIYRNHRPNIQLCEDAKTFIQSLYLYRMAFITDGPIDSQHAKSHSLGLLPWIEFPLYTSELGIPKPALAPFQLVAKFFDLPYKNCIYFADNPKKDFIAPHALGMRTVRIRRPGSLHYDLLSGDDVDFEIPDFGDLL